MKSPPLQSLLLANTLAATGVLGVEYPDCKNGPLANNTVCDASASPPDRAAALVRAMNITEKLSNLVDMSLGAERLSLPAYAWWNEALHGVARSPGVTFNESGSGGDGGGGDVPFAHATSFANTITVAAAFDDELVYQIADVISTEARAFANAGMAGLDYWTPNVNPYKDPPVGRGHETPGEDPVRIKGYVKALLEGLEGTGAVRKVIATCKHFAAYDLERWGATTRHDFDAVVSLQDLVEYYLPPFQQCARDSRVGSLMCAYNAVNGTPACASTYLMDDVLRKHWSWTEHNNYITSDCNAVQDFLPEHHNFSQTPAEAAAAAYTAGTDLVCEIPSRPPLTDVAGAFNQSLLSEEVIDRALRRLYEGLVRAGYFDGAGAGEAEGGAAYRALSWADVDTAAARALALRSAADGLVLLKNERGTLPLGRLTEGEEGEGRRVMALVGHWANATRQMLGGYSGAPPYLEGAVQAAERLGLAYRYAEGPRPARQAGVQDTWTGPALEAARDSDVVLYFGGTDLTVAAEDRDRESVAWDAAQLRLIEDLARVGKPLVVVQLGDQLDDRPLLRNPNVSAVLWAGYPGQSGGLAVLRAVMGLDGAAPAGRLPVTQYAAGYVERVAMTEMALRPGSDGRPGRTYRWLAEDDAESVVLPFGYGLHYTSFRARFGVFTGLQFSTEELLAGCDEGAIAHLDLCPFAPQVSVWVTNAGNVTSDYVALVFVAGEFGPEPYPVKTLVGYKRLREIQPGGTSAAVVDIKLGDLARVDERGNRVLYPGRYKLMLDVPSVSEFEFEIVGEEIVLDKFPQPSEGQ